MGGGLLLDPLDGDTEEMYLMYRYCKLFHCSPAEYERRPFKETQWLLEIDRVYNEVVREKQEEANERG